MNRLSGLILRRGGRWAVAAPLPAPIVVQSQSAPAWLDDLRLFATGWIGGLVFFGTYLS
jgi:hypothetical protein